MQINITDDSSVSLAPVGFTSALNQAVQFLEQTFASPITINIEVGWGEIGGARLPSGVIGEGGPLGGTLYTYSQVQAALASNINSTADATAVANLPATDPTHGGSFYIGGAEEKALGLIGANASGLDGDVGFQGTVGVGTIEHEITHAMGRVADLGASNEFSVLDLFRYTGGGILSPTALDGAYFSADGGKTAINTFDSTSDPADWAGATPDAFNAFGGTTDPVSPGDIEEMNVLGFASAAPTVSGSLITLGSTAQTVTGGAGDTIIGGSGPAVINAIAGSVSVVGGDGPTTVYGGLGDTIAAGSGNTYIDGTGGDVAIFVGSGGTDTIIGSAANIVGGASKSPDTITGGAAVVQIPGLGRGDILNFAGQTGIATINAAAGNVAATLGGGPATVYGGAGDTVALGSVSQYVDGSVGRMKIAVGSGGTDTITGSTSAATGTGADTITGGAAAVQLPGLGRGDVVNFAAQTGIATITATAGNIAATLGGGPATVYGGAGDSITLGSGNQYADGSAGGTKIAVGSGGADIIIGSTLAAAGTAADTLTGGVAAVQVEGLGRGDVVNFAAQTGIATINATAGNIAATLGGGAATVYGGAGDTVALGSGSQYVDGTAGAMKIAAGSGGTDLIIGSTLAKAGTGVDTITGGAAAIQIAGLGKGDVVNFAGQSGNATINATAGNIAATLGGGPATLYGGAGDTVALGSGSQYVDGTAGAMKIAAGSGGTDLIIGSTLAAGVAVDTLTGGVAAVQIAGLGRGDIVNFAGQSGNATINATAGNIALTLGAGGASVYAGAGDTIGLGSVSQYVDAGQAGTTAAGGAGTLITLGTGGGTDNIVGSTVPGAGVTVKGGAASLNYNPGTGNDLINLAGTTGAATINAFGADTGPVNDTVIASNGGDSVWGGQGDRIGVGLGASGTDLFTHASTIRGASIGFGTNDTVVAATYGASAGAVTVNSAVTGASSARVTISGFAETGGAPADSIFYQNESASRTASIVATSTQVSVNGAASTQFTLPDGTVMTLFGVPNADFNTAFFKP